MGVVYWVWRLGNWGFFRFCLAEASGLNLSLPVELKKPAKLAGICILKTERSLFRGFGLACEVAQDVMQDTAISEIL